MPSLLKANVFILQVEVNKHLRILLFLCKHSRAWSSFYYTYNPQSSCSQSGEEFLWNWCKDAHSYSFNGVSRLNRWGWEIYFSLCCVITYKLYFPVELASAHPLLPWCNDWWNCNHSSAGLWGIALISSNPALSKSVQPGTNNLGSCLDYQQYLQDDSVEKWLD